jgi:galactokinase
MGTDLADRLGAAPELRLASYTYRELFGHPPAGVWHAPGTVTLLADGPLRLTVAARWGAIVAAAPRGDGVIEAIRMNRPDERVHLTLAEAAAGAGPSWAGTALRGARAGATLLVNTDLPDGSGLGAAAATETAIGLALEDLVLDDTVLEDTVLEDTAAAGDRAGAAGAAGPVGHRPGRALLGDRGLPFDLSAAGLRLMVIDTRVRDLPRPPIVEHAPVREAAAALEAGSFEALGPMLTAAHAALAAAVPAADDVQRIAVSAALDGGALGARMLVDGPGRPACALLRATLLTDVRRAIVAAFSVRRLRIPRLLTVEPAAGPRRAG